MITEVTGFLQQTDRIVWGPWLIFLLLGCGCYLMISLFFLPLRNCWRHLGWCFILRAGKAQMGRGFSFFSSDYRTGGNNRHGKYRRRGYCHGAGRTGSIVLDAFVRDHWAVDQTGGKYAVCRYRVRDHKGKPVGGPMYVLQNAFPYRRMGRILAVLFAIFAVLASFGMGNMTQGNSIAEALAVTFGVDRTVTGLVIGIFTIW